MAKQISVLLIEGRSLTRIAIRAILDGTTDIRLVGETENAESGFLAFQNLSPDVSILALRIGEHCSIDLLDSYVRFRPTARIIMLADHAGDVEISRSLRKGALGYLCSDVKPDELVKAIRVVAAGRRFIPGDIASILSEYVGQEELTPTETNVLQMIVGGMSNKEIAFALDVSENTVKTHNKNIFGKIGVSDRTSAATVAIKRGLVRVDL